jgi:hypothetical protein
MAQIKNLLTEQKKNFCVATLNNFSLVSAAKQEESN